MTSNDFILVPAVHGVAQATRLAYTQNCINSVAVFHGKKNVGQINRSGAILCREKEAATGLRSMKKDKSVD